MRHLEVAGLRRSGRKRGMQKQPEPQLLPGVTGETSWLRLRGMKTGQDYFGFRLSPWRSVCVQEFTVVKSGAFLLCWEYY